MLKPSNHLLRPLGATHRVENRGQSPVFLESGGKNRRVEGNGSALKVAERNGLGYIKVGQRFGSGGFPGTAIALTNACSRRATRAADAKR